MHVMENRKRKIKWFCKFGIILKWRDDPEASVDVKLRKLYCSRFIDKLYYYWLNNLLLPNIEKLTKLAFAERFLATSWYKMEFLI